MYGYVCVLACTSAHGHLATPGAVGAAGAVLGPARQEEAHLAGVDQGVAERRQVHAHHRHVRGTLWLLTGVGCQDRRRKRKTKSSRRKRKKERKIERERKKERERSIREEAFVVHLPFVSPICCPSVVVSL